MTSKYQFEGYPKYLQAAADTLDMPAETIAEAQRQPAISRLASLIGQTVDQAPEDRAETLRHARRFRDALCVAALAADAMLDEAHDAYGLPLPPTLLTIPESVPEPIMRPKPKRTS